MKTLTLSEFHAQAKTQNVMRDDVAFVCPMCGTIQSPRLLISEGIGACYDTVKTIIGFNCVGRYTGKDSPNEEKGKGHGCNWSLGGLLQMHELEVLRLTGNTSPVLNWLHPSRLRSWSVVWENAMNKANTITKHQWVGIEDHLKTGRAVNFKYQGADITVRKMQVSETKLAYIIQVNDKALLGFLKEGHHDYQPLSAVFLRKRIINPYASTVRKIAAKRGGKAYLKRKENSWMTERSVEVTDTFFPTARTVVSHFRKIEGLELVTPVLINQEASDAAAC